MSYSVSLERLELVVASSRRLFVFLLISHTLAGLAVLLLPVAPSLRLLLLGAVLACLLVTVKRRVMMRGRGVVRALRYRQGQWFIYRDSAWRRVELRQLTVWSWLVSLEFQLVWRRVPVLLLPDSCDADSFRRLRLMAKRQPLSKTNKEPKSRSLLTRP